MRQLNLLPPQRRENLQREFFLAAVRRFVASVVAGLLLVSLGGVMAGGFIVILIELDERSVEDQLAGPLQQHREVRAKIAQGNRLISTVAELSTSRIVWSDFIAEVLAMVPAGATVEALHIDERSRVFTLSGTAPTRTSLVEFEDRLRGLSWASEIEAPRDNLLRAVNPPYRFSIHINLPGGTPAAHDAPPTP